MRKFILASALVVSCSTPALPQETTPSLRGSLGAVTGAQVVKDIEEKKPSVLKRPIIWTKKKIEPPVKWVGDQMDKHPRYWSTVKLTGSMFLWVLSAVNH